MSDDSRAEVDVVDGSGFSRSDVLLALVKRAVHEFAGEPPVIAIVSEAGAVIGSERRSRRADGVHE